jgi:hypothetical protein
VPVHPLAAAVEQHGTRWSIGDGVVDCASYRGWQWHEGLLAALAMHEQDAVSVFFAEVVHVGSAGLADA